MATVEILAAAQQLAALNTHPPTPLTLTYRSDEPYTVHLTVDRSGFGQPSLAYQFDRDILRDGLDGAAGLGQVTICPWLDGHITTLSLATPAGPVMYQVQRAVLAGFLARTYHLVPQGHESKLLDLDNAAERLLRH